MELESFTSLDEQVTAEDWAQTPSSVRQLLQWLLESYEQRLAGLEAEKLVSTIESDGAEKRNEDVSAMLADQKEPSCSFCGKSEKEVSKICTGPGVRICKECVELCNSILNDEEE